MAGVDVAEMPAATALNVLYSLVVDEAVGGDRGRHEARIAVDEWLADVWEQILMDTAPEKLAQEWGLREQDQQGMDLAMSLIHSGLEVGDAE